MLLNGKLAEFHKETKRFLSITMVFHRWRGFGVLVENKAGFLALGFVTFSYIRTDVVTMLAQCLTLIDEADKRLAYEEK